MTMMKRCLRFAAMTLVVVGCVLTAPGCTKKTDDTNWSWVFLTSNGDRIKPEELGLTNKEITQILLAEGLTPQLVHEGNAQKMMDAYLRAMNKLIDLHFDKIEAYGQRTGQFIVRLENASR
jgi:hypothetical protein